jgi:hypothetical protein
MRFLVHAVSVLSALLLTLLIGRKHRGVHTGGSFMKSEASGLAHLRLAFRVFEP